VRLFLRRDAQGQPSMKNSTTLLSIPLASGPALLIFSVLGGSLNLIDLWGYKHSGMVLFSKKISTC